MSRNIFEDVSTEAAPPRRGAPAGAPSRAGVIRWLMALFGLVVLIVLVGGLTRLTDSGLSITEWAPISGALPPLSAADWQSAFAKYQEIPEFTLQNAEMTLDQFKTIYWWEWGHRQLGRLVGLVWAIGFVWFLARGAIPPGWTGRFLLLGVLGGLQGLVGWWMVSSGLSGRVVDVASYRLAIHLGLAFVILGIIARYILVLRMRDGEVLQARRRRETRLQRGSAGLVGLTFAQVVLGALVAGLDAGQAFVDWPLMAGQVFPSEALDMTPIYLNFFENEAMVQFVHRTAGYLLLAAAAAMAWRARASALTAVRRWFMLVAGVVAVQAVIGIVTVLWAAPMALAVLHQAGALITWVVVLRARHEVLYPAKQGLR